MKHVVVCVATDLEAAGLPSTDRVGNLELAVVKTGVGPVNAALGLARHLALRNAPAGDVEAVDLVVSLGVGGAYPDSGLAIGDVVCAVSEYYGDLGAQSPQGFLDMEALGFAVVGEHYNRLPLGFFPTATRCLFVTRSTCTGTEAEAREIVERTGGGAVESMEGAAIVHTAITHALPVAEVRGISNMVGDRDRSKWRLDEAARAAGSQLAQWLEAQSC